MRRGRRRRIRREMGATGQRRTGESSASGQAWTPRVLRAGVIGIMIKVSAPPFEYVVARQVRVRERR